MLLYNQVFRRLSGQEAKFTFIRREKLGLKSSINEARYGASFINDSSLEV